ncbi:hypothetical protein N566_26025 [Streptomycetaceae bacterium MP113-05]|nr:hypothetical protein N566_26025 [Streptomycetaceae bacterium MP113-05]
MPVFWYDVPHGYLPLDVSPTAESLDDLAAQIRALPENVRDQADQVFRLYAIVIWELQKNRVQGCALGMHPDGDGEPTTSVLTLFSVNTNGASPKATLTTLMSGGFGDSAESGFVPLELPCGLGFRAETVRAAPAPRQPPAGSDQPAVEQVWQGMVAIPDARSSSIIVVQLVTASVDLADDYRNVLQGVARTVSFTDPTRGDAGGEEDGPMPGSAAEAVRNDFG